MKLLLSALILFFSFQLTFAERSFFVSTEGNDSWSGTLAEPNADNSDGPFATVQKARDQIMTLSASGDITVHIREGVYFLGETLKFDPIHSGRGDTEITYKNYDNEDVTLSGGKPITGWQQEGAMFVTEIPEVKSGDLYFKELYVNDERRDRARTPNKGEFYRINGSVAGNEKRAIRFLPGDLQAYDNLNDVNFVLYRSWLSVHLWIDEIDMAQSIVECSPQLARNAGYFDNRTRYYVENAYECLDAPGEWYLNRETGKLYYYPITGETLESIEVVAPITDRVIELAGQPNKGDYVEYLHFSGLKIKHADWKVVHKSHVEGQAHVQLDDAIVHMKGAMGCSFTDCEIALGGAHGVIVTNGSADNLIQKCHIHALGGGGVYVGDTSPGWNSCQNPDANNEIIETTIDNCFIHNLTNVHHGSVGVWLGCTSDNNVTHNEICDLDYTGISVGWCWSYDESFQQNNFINNNHIHHLGQGELSDMGGVYTLGLSDGTVVSNNIIHDVYAFHYGGWGLYTDQATTDIVMENNVVYNVKSEAFHQHYGQDNIIRNNILGFAEEAGFARSKNEQGNSFNFENNIVLSKIGVMADGQYSDNNFKMDNNIYWDVELGDRLDFNLGTFEEWRARGFDANSKTVDPMFVDPENNDFNLQSDSPALEMGFQPIDMNSVGLYGDTKWTTLPDGVEHREVYKDAWSPKTPLFSMDEFFDDFEDTALGAYPQYTLIYGIKGPKTQSIYVSNNKAQSGSQSMRIDDKELTERPYEPYLRYFPTWYEAGLVTVEFDMYMEPNTSITHEWRDNKGYPESRGVSIDLKPNNLWKDGDVSVRIPTDGWFHLKIECPVGAIANSKFDVTITVDDVSVTRKRSLINKNWNRFLECYFISGTNTDASVYVDNVHLKFDRSTDVSNNSSDTIVRDFELSRNYPNPFNPTTTISYYVADPHKNISLDIYNANGQLVRELVNERHVVGDHEIEWNGTDDSGTQLASGAYFLKMKVQDRDQVWTQKLLLLK